MAPYREKNRKKGQKEKGKPPERKKRIGNPL